MAAAKLPVHERRKWRRGYHSSSTTLEISRYNIYEIHKSLLSYIHYFTNVSYLHTTSRIKQTVEEIRQKMSKTSETWQPLEATENRIQLLACSTRVCTRVGHSAGTVSLLFHYKVHFEKQHYTKLQLLFHFSFFIFSN